MSSLIGPWLPGAHSQTLPHVKTLLPPIQSAIAHAAARTHAAPATSFPPAATSANAPIEVETHRTYDKLLLAASPPSAVSETEAMEQRMMAMTAGPAVPAAELTALLAAATLAHRPPAPRPPVGTAPIWVEIQESPRLPAVLAVSVVTTGLTPVSTTTTTSIAPPTTPAPPPLPPL